MLHQRTTNPVKRAAHIAMREAKRVWRSTRDRRKKRLAQAQTFKAVLLEMHYDSFLRTKRKPFPR